MSFSSTLGTGGLSVAENVFLNALGYNLLQEPGKAGSTLTVSFDTPTRQVRSLPIVVREVIGNPTVTVRIFSGGAVVGTVQVTTAGGVLAVTDSFEAR